MSDLPASPVPDRLGEEARGPGFAALTETLAEHRDLPQAYAAAFEVWQAHLTAAVSRAREEEREACAHRLMLRGERWRGDAALMAEQLASEWMKGHPS
jgi:hypothetical protein